MPLLLHRLELALVSDRDQISADPAPGAADPRGGARFFDKPQAPLSSANRSRPDQLESRIGQCPRDVHASARRAHPVALGRSDQPSAPVSCKKRIDVLAKDVTRRLHAPGQTLARVWEGRRVGTGHLAAVIVEIRLRPCRPGATPASTYFVAADRAGISVSAEPRQLQPRS